MTPTTDELLDGRYQLGELIARGGMGEVWQAHDLVLQRTVAAKVLRTTFVDDPSFRARFRAEARHAARLTYPGIAQVFDYGEGDGVAYLVLELVPGESLSALLKREGRLSVDRTLALIAQAAAALHVAHDAGVVHRDVKPGNLLVTPDDQVKITDFGIARATGDATGLTAAGQVLGTAYYLAPEQARGRRAGPASDIYALGVVAYECLAGRRPFNGDNPTFVALAQVREEPPPLPADIPEPVRALVTRMLAKEPASRPANAGEVALAAAALRSQYSTTGPAATGPAATGPAASGRPPGRARALKSSRPATDLLASTETLPAIEALPAARRPSPLVVAGAVAAAVLCAIAITAAVTIGPKDAPAVQPGAAAAPTARPTAAASPTSSTPTAKAQRTVEVDPTKFVGRRFVTVREALLALGLNVRRVSSDERGVPGTVTGVAPDGSVEVGSTIKVSVIELRPHGENEPGRKKGKG